MTSVTPTRHRPFGVWVPAPIPPEQASQIEQLGYSALWVGANPPAELNFVEPILHATDHLVVATGVVNIWAAPADRVAESYHRIENAYPGRFLLGIGVGHREHTSEYRNPYQAMTKYLDELDAAGVPARHRLIAAMGPKMLRLAATRSAGTHPALSTVGHNIVARAAIGPFPVIAPIQSVLLTDDKVAGRAAGRQLAGSYLKLENYVKNWRRLGFTQDDVAPGGSDRLVDALLAHGSAEDVALRLYSHLASGADHVVVQVFTGGREFLPTLTQLALALDVTAQHTVTAHRSST
ncbi:LLM class F420-dependent oxidoreductase [Mycobacterium sp. pUA109]|uniref:LLM class F420-dependent oxidoreductase n=1 Tax=Mycobacterium sp. pUA109 TaxID=3238982 RepID=UPI00351BB39E